MTNRSLALPVLILITTIACGGSGASPTGPASTGAGGASIAGTVQSGTSSAMTAVGAGNAIPGLVVTVVGTSISSGLDAAGRFTLQNVPAGDIQLQFSGPATGTITVSAVKTTETITLVVAVTSSSVTLESAARSSAGTEELEGRVESLPPTMAAGALKVAGRIVTTDAATQIRHGSSALEFDDIQIGYRVHVRGLTSGANLVASSIEIQNTITTIPVNVNGIISDLAGTPAAFEFRIGSRVVKGDASTGFFGDGDSPDSFASLEDGVRVEVKGLQRDGHVYAARIHINGDDEAEEDEDDAEQDTSASIHGALMQIGGSAPTLQLLVGTTTVRTTSGTEVRRRGDVQTLAALTVGMDLHVVGTRQPDGSLDARMIQITDDAPGGAFEIQGAAGGVSGSCPALTFSINGFSIRTTAATTFDGTTCAAMKSGTKVTVTGVVQADNSVLATLVKKD
jgi:hypothetical protein